MRKIILLVLPVLCISTTAFCQAPKFTKQANIVYGMYSGTALPMDVYIPEKPNGKGIIFICGSAYGVNYAQGYNQVSLKTDFENPEGYQSIGKKLLEYGYTVFVPDHRFAPRFKYKDIISDVQRAVKFIRYHANDYKIDPKNIGAMGHSSGANLSSLLGTLDSSYYTAADKIDSVSSKVQAVVTSAAPFNLLDYDPVKDSAMAYDFINFVQQSYIGTTSASKPDSVGTASFAAASPIFHVDKNDAPTLIYYSDNDPLIPVRHAVDMDNKLKAAGVPEKLVVKKNTGHGAPPDMQEVDAWFKRYLNQP